MERLQWLWAPLDAVGRPWYFLLERDDAQRAFVRGVVAGDHGEALEVVAGDGDRKTAVAIRVSSASAATPPTVSDGSEPRPHCPKAFGNEPRPPGVRYGLANGV